MRFLKSKNWKKSKKLTSKHKKSQKIGGSDMIHGFDDSTKEKVQFKDAVIISDIETTYASVPSGSSFANYINAQDYMIDGYDFLGIVRWSGDLRLAIASIIVSSSDNKLGITVMNVSGTDALNATIKMKGLYVKR